MSAFITSIDTASPAHKVLQQQALDFMACAHGMDARETKKLGALYRATGIQSRYSVIGDYSPLTRGTFYPPTADLEPFPSTKKRMQLFQKEAIKLCEEACRKALRDTSPGSITHLITVSCTGMYAPGIDIELIGLLGLNTSVERTGIHFMGCYAALNALRVANAICAAEPQAQVLIVCVELCSIHFQKKKIDDYLLANALFGDGAAAMVVKTRAAEGINLEAVAFYSDLRPDGHNDMAWSIGDFGFEMRLSACVPDIIESGISRLVQQLKDRTGVKKFDLFAIHPGGKKILQVIEAQLGIAREDNFAAHEVLAEYGNMSSPTILFVLNKLKSRLEAGDVGKNILALAFGPGLTMESAHLRVTYR